MKRKNFIKKILLFTLSLNFTFGNSSFINALPYSQNDIYRHWSGKYIKTLFDNEVAKGYADKTFGANLPATREKDKELNSSISNEDKLNDEKENTEYIQLPKDIQGKWSENIFRKFTDLGIISDKAEINFRPKYGVTREEFADFLYL